MRKFIYHANCWDGFCSAWLGHLVWPDAEFIPANYGWKAPDVTGCDVVIADFSYPRDVLIDMKAKANSIIVLDHHKTSQEDLVGLDFCTFDMERSGARLVWDYLWEQGLINMRMFVENPLPGGYPHGYVHWMVKYIEDRDLWRKSLQCCNEVNAAIRSYPLDFKVWDAMARRDMHELIMEGVAILRQQRQVIDHHLQHLQWIEIDGLKGKGCACSTAHIWSEIMEVMMATENIPFAIVWCDTINGDRLYSIRSLENGPDVSTIARKFGGGGHARAAGFKVKYSTTLTGDFVPLHSKIEKQAAAG